MKKQIRNETLPETGIAESAISILKTIWRFDLEVHPAPRSVDKVNMAALKRCKCGQIIRTSKAKCGNC